MVQNHRDAHIVAARSEVEREVEIRSERVINWIRIGFVAGAGTLDAFGAFALGQRAIGTMIVASSIALIAILLVVGRFLRQETFRPWVKYLTIAGDFALITTAFAFYTHEWIIADPAHLPIPFYGVVLMTNVVSALRAGKVVILYSTALALGAALAQASLIGAAPLIYAFLTFGVLFSGGLTLALSAARVHMLVRLQQREALMRFLPRPMVDAVDRGELELALGGRTVEATILMTDIRGFTTLAEGMDPQALVSWLNEFLTRMTDVIHRHGGIVDKYIGDAILAVFGAPESDEDHALHAVEAAQAMRQELADINKQRASLGEAPLQIGIGIHTGPVVAGNVGSAERMDYTVMGDTVNTASRIESLTKTHEHALLLSEDTHSRLSRAVDTREVGETEIRGRRQGLKLFTVGP